MTRKIIPILWIVRGLLALVLLPKPLRPAAGVMMAAFARLIGEEKHAAMVEHMSGKVLTKDVASVAFVVTMTDGTAAASEIKREEPPPITPPAACVNCGQCDGHSITCPCYIAPLKAHWVCNHCQRVNNDARTHRFSCDQERFTSPRSDYGVVVWECRACGSAQHHDRQVCGCCGCSRNGATLAQVIAEAQGKAKP